MSHPLSLSAMMSCLMQNVRSFWHKRVRAYRRQVWPGFMLLLSIIILSSSFAGLSWFSGVYLLLFMAGLTWAAWQWRAMQLSVVLLAALSALIILTNTGSHLVTFISMAMSGLLLASLLLAGVFEFVKQTFINARHIHVLCWSVVVSGMLLILLRGSEKQHTGLHYAGLPVTTGYDVLLLSIVIMVFLYLLLLRSQTRIRGSFIGLFPASMLGLYVAWFYLTHDMRQQHLPELVLEHGLLLIHVPAMIIAFALLINGSGFALLHLISDRQRLSGGQNRDILETIQNSLQDYLYQQVVLAVMLLGAGLLTGMFWANLAWGHYWQGDAKQVMSLAVWFYYLAGLHLRLQKGMQGRAFAWWCVLGAILLLMSFIGTNLWPQGLHKFGAL